jgi:CRISPR-associated protein Cmr6
MMRRSLPLRPLPEHAGLAYDVWAPLDAKHETSDSSRDRWLDEVAGIPTPAGYDVFIARWKDSLAGAEHRLIHAQTQGRLLVGHGNWSPTEVGLTLHRTWGVPVIPGSAIKGVMAHFAADTRGSEDPEWTGPGLDEHDRVREGPGKKYRTMFGAPPLDHGDDPGQRGALIVHDGLWDHGPGAPIFARDVLTVHHRSYYSGEELPNDWESPVPVPFLSVRSGARFVFALSCIDPTLTDVDGRDLLDDAETLLQAALQEYGVGGKTSAGYGRFGSPSEESV